MIYPVTMRYNQLSDEKLVDLIARRDAVAFDVLYERYARQALAVALLAGLDRAAAEAIVEQFFWDVWRCTATLTRLGASVRNSLMLGVRQLAQGLPQPAL